MERFSISGQLNEQANHVDTVWPYWNLMDFTPEGRPDIPTPPQNFRSEFLEEKLSEQRVVEAGARHVPRVRMLGVRRAGVTVALNYLEHRGVIRLSRKQIIITDRKGLKASANGTYHELEAPG